MIVGADLERAATEARLPDEDLAVAKKLPVAVTSAASGSLGAEAVALVAASMVAATGAVAGLEDSEPLKDTIGLVSLLADIVAARFRVALDRSLVAYRAGAEFQLVVLEPAEAGVALGAPGALVRSAAVRKAVAAGPEPERLAQVEAAPAQLGWGRVALVVAAIEPTAPGSEPKLLADLPPSPLA